MLIELRVSNFRSIREKQIFSMVKTKFNKSKGFKSDFENDQLIELVPSAATFGSNASGKSNFIASFQVIQAIALYSASQIQRGEDLPIVPFLLDTKFENTPSEFGLSILVGGKIFEFEFSATSKRVLSERLRVYQQNKKSELWYERTYSKENDKYNWHLSNNLENEKQTWQNATRSNSLFFSTAVLLNCKSLLPLYDWLRINLRIAPLGGSQDHYTTELCESDMKEAVMDFLQLADPDIRDVIKKNKLIEDIGGQIMPESPKDRIQKKIKETQKYDVVTVHKNNMKDDVYFDLTKESRGTNKLYSYAGPFIDALKNGYLIVIDEFNDSLHPKLQHFLVNLFQNEQVNRNNAQLIFTTHDTSILNEDIIDRDQVWFCEKDKHNSTQIYSLSDFQPNKKAENLELGYLSGRFGGTPIFQQFSLEEVTQNEKTKEY